jgi:hypothetical protein
MSSLSATRSLDPGFWRKSKRKKGCWIWQGAKTKGAHLVYGQVERGGKRWRTHRYAWLLAYGPIPEGLFVCHRCDVPLCINPSHLFLGTHGDNMDDMSKKGRAKGQPAQHLRSDGISKQCVSCDAIKPIELFWKDRSRPDGLRNDCTACVKAYRLSLDRVYGRSGGRLRVLPPTPAKRVGKPAKSS